MVPGEDSFGSCFEKPDPDKRRRRRRRRRRKRLHFVSNENVVLMIIASGEEINVSVSHKLSDDFGSMNDAIKCLLGTDAKDRVAAQMANHLMLNQTVTGSSLDCNYFFLIFFHEKVILMFCDKLTLTV